MSNPNPQAIWLVSFPFSDLTSSKLRPALVLANHRQDVIILGIFSKIPPNPLSNHWILLDDRAPNFPQTGLRKASLLRADKIATVHYSVFRTQLGTLPNDKMQLVQIALKRALNLNSDRTSD
jgi:mRNA interferase MazF